MDGFSRFVTTYLLKSKSEDEVNGYMKQYIAWAERQHGRRVDTVVTRRWNAEKESTRRKIGPVKQVLTDKGAEFCNNSIERWYTKKGIVRTKVGSKSSQLNLVERTHKTLIGMTLQTAVYIKNRVFCKGAGRTPYEMMYGAKPDMHHIRTFGSLRKKLEVNCKVGFLIGYQEDVVGCQVYFPTEHQKGYVTDVKVNETIKYKDRYGSEFKTKVNKWLQTCDEYIRDGDFDDVESDSEESQRAECDENSVRDDSNVEMQSAAASADDLNEAEQELWDDMHDLANNDQQLWNDILRNSSLLDYDDACETQEGVDAEAVSLSWQEDLAMGLI
ncbi:LOW QUALITY PROTEIN: Integrase, catalytic core protein [Phytophthora megakarya]|uniref:Integrase, catalytic core protein n=1 Tax=Phytophthora megakarya TaxID=4795 RepID=A0A225UII1_9STRA|nr:LOW QUALITY PROTEIN: Integrase, catalytic core protein [Phytophthora megakarya]